MLWRLKLVWPLKLAHRKCAHRHPVILIGLGGVFLVSAALAQSTKTFSIDPPPLVLDGEGNHVGNIDDMTVTLTGLQEGRAIFSIDYGFYNGSGTWRGNQTIVAQFKNASDGVITQVSVPLDRGHCVYGGSERRHTEGYMPDVVADVAKVDVLVSRVSGVQTGC